MHLLKSRFQKVCELIAQAEKKHDRCGQVQLVAVSKNKPAHLLRQVWHMGQRHFGESYLQEAMKKIEELRDLPGIHWHFIGHIQSNKTLDISRHFDWVHSVDRFKIASRLNNQRKETRSVLNICIQVNISGEASKSGVSLSELPNLVQDISSLPNLKLRGLMAIPPIRIDTDKKHLPYRMLSNLLHTLNKQFSLDMDTLSMGMTDDLEIAIQEGATIVRVGTALFGTRHYDKE